MHRRQRPVSVLHEDLAQVVLPSARRASAPKEVSRRSIDELGLACVGQLALNSWMLSHRVRF